MLIWPMMGAGFTVNMLQRGAASLSRINEVLDVVPAIASPADGRRTPVDGGIEVHELSFTYPGAGAPAIQGVSFAVPKGSFLGILGRTGSGKSTLIQLLPRLLDPPADTVRIDGTDVRSYDLDALRGSFGIVPQSTFLFSATIEKNIAFACPDASPDHIRMVGHLAALDTDIGEFPDRWQTVVGERGVTLSGGQRQRLAIARALLPDPEILILDDALSAVDTRTEERILKGVLAHRSGRTTIVISNRVSTFQEADQVLVLEDGQISHRGTHEELLAQPGTLSRYLHAAAAGTGEGAAMIEHHDDEKIISAYDPRLVRRIAAFARPYRLLIGAAIAFLLVGTVGEMLVPVMIQRTVDHEILDFWVSVEATDAHLFGVDSTSSGASDREAYRIDDRLYLREENLDRLPRDERSRLNAAGSLDTDRVIIVPVTILEANPRIAAAVEDSIVTRGEDVTVLRRSVLEELSPEDRLTLRERNIAGLRRNVVIFFFVLIGVLLSAFGQVYLTAYTGQLVMKDLRLRIFDHIIHQHLGYLSTQPVGKLVTRTTNDVQTINELFTSVLTELTKNVSLMVAVVITMFSLNTRLATIVLMSMVPVIVITDVFRRKARTAYRLVRVAVSKVNTYLSEYISGMSIVQLFVQQTRSRREFAERNDELLDAHLAELHVFAVFRPIVDFMATISTAVVIYFGARLLQVEVVSLGVLIAYTNLIRRFYMPVMSISEQFTVVQSAMAGAERVFGLLDEDVRIPDTGEQSILPGPVEGRISFERVRFAYKKDEPVLKDVSFSVPPGAMVAVVGYTGAGKTTIINLLTRLWDVDGGRITLDGVDLRGDSGQRGPHSDPADSAGCPPLQRHHSYQHHPRTGRPRRENCCGMPGGPAHGSPRFASGRTGHDDSGTGCQSLRRTAAAHILCPRPRPRSSGARSRRGDLEYRQRDGEAVAACG
jgi:ATP-binding cassette subfamily B multidrug efflux pump